MIYLFDNQSRESLEILKILNTSDRKLGFNQSDLHQRIGFKTIVHYLLKKPDDLTGYECLTYSEYIHRWREKVEVYCKSPSSKLLYQDTSPLSNFLRYTALAISSDDLPLKYKQRLFTLLQQLEKIDPTLQSVTFDAFRALRGSLKAKRHLRAFSKNRFNPMQVSFPMPESRLNRSFPPLGPFKKAVAMKKFLIGSDGTIHTKNLIDIGKKEGFKVEKTPITASWSRDIFLALSHYKVLIPAEIPSQNGAAFKGEVGYFLRHGTPQGRNFGLMGWVDISKKTTEMLKGNYLGVFEAPFYFEGGNLLKATNATGETVYLSGSYNRLYTALNCRSLRKLNISHKDVLNIHKKLPLEQAEIELALEKLNTLNLLDGFPTDEMRKKAAQLFLAISAIVHEKMEKALSKRCIEIGSLLKPQIEFHLDTFLLPAPKGVILIQDHALSATLLDELLKKDNLQPTIRERLELYLSEAKKLELFEGKDLNETARKLRSENFNVIGVPGSFFTNANSRIPGVNFLNGFIIDGTNSLYAITNGSSHPADAYLRTLWLETLLKIGVEKCYFVGRNTQDIDLGVSHHSSYAEADQFRKNHGGIHCFANDLGADELFFSFRQHPDPKPSLHAEQKPPFKIALPQFLSELINLM